jgi:hypothetical protein
MEELETAISANVPLRDIVAALREYRSSGVSRDEVQFALKALRENAHDEATEDRILEVMDVVSGFCSRENSDWEN